MDSHIQLYFHTFPDSLTWNSLILNFQTCHVVSYQTWHSLERFDLHLYHEIFPDWIYLPWGRLKRIGCGEELMDWLGQLIWTKKENGQKDKVGWKWLNWTIQSEKSYKHVLKINVKFSYLKLISVRKCYQN